MTAWSLGFQETEPGVWKIYRISPSRYPTVSWPCQVDSCRLTGSHIGPNDRHQPILAQVPSPPQAAIRVCHSLAVHDLLSIQLFAVRVLDNDELVLLLVVAILLVRGSLGSEMLFALMISVMNSS